MKNTSTTLRHYWIIKNAPRNIIWKDIYHSFNEAQTELTFQTSQLPIEKNSKNWKIEQHSYFGAKESKEDSDFNSF